MLIKFNKKKPKIQALVTAVDKHVSESTKRRICECGDWVQFMADREVAKMKVNAANFCKNRFCPICAWRLAQKDAMKISILMDYIEAEHKKAFIFVTLTAPNVNGEDLKSEIDKYNKAFLALFKRINRKTKIIHGYIRKLEVTYNGKRNDYHPHFHCVFAVNTSYFTGRDYIKQETWLNLWRDVMGDDTIMEVDVRRVKKSDNSKEINEIAKYAAKDEDYLKCQTVFDVFYNSLKGRQIITFNGLFAEANKKFKDGELDSYMLADTTEYFWMLLYRWGGSEYAEKNRRELTADELKRIKGMLIDEMDID